MDVRDVSSRHIAHVTLVMFGPLFASIATHQPPSHLLRLIREALRPGPSLIHLLLHLILLIIDCTPGRHLVLLDQVALGKVHHALSEGLVELLVVELLVACVLAVDAAVVAVCSRLDAGGTR